MNEDIYEIVKLYNGMKSFIPISKKKYIYHYTSPEGLQGILEKSNLRFSDRNFLNDSSEGSYVLDLLANNIEKVCENAEELILDLKQKCVDRKKRLINEAFHTYQCSFSLNNDSLCLWNYYTKGDNIKGYNLKFDVEELAQSLIPKQMNTQESVLKPILGEVIYDNKIQINIIKNIIEAFTDLYHNSQGFRLTIIDYIIDKILLNGKFFKMPYFKVEQEFRIVFSTMILSDMRRQGIPDVEKFRELNGYYIPYIEKDFEPPTLLGITMSPTLDLELTKESLKRILKYKYPHVEVINSQIPVRY